MAIHDSNLEFEQGFLVQNQFSIEHELGRGAMGIVYLATQLQLERPVALKVFPIDGPGADDPDQMFKEARAAGALSHRHIVQVYSAGRITAELGYFAMEYVAGEPLGDRIVRRKRLNLETALRLGEEVADALRHGWEKLRLTHGDIKPDNVMLTPNGEAKLADFGLARAASFEHEDQDVRLTPLYAPPELISGDRKQGDCRSDMYSFGAMLYHMIAGQPPFPGDDPHEVMKRQVRETPVPLKRRFPQMDEGVSDFLDQLLQKDPDRRPESWEELTRKLGALRESVHKRLHPKITVSRRSSASRVRSARPSVKPSSSSKGVLAVVLLILLAVAASLALIAVRIGGGTQSQAQSSPTSDAPSASEPQAPQTAMRTQPPDTPESAPPQQEPVADPRASAEQLDQMRTITNEREMAPTSDRRAETLPEQLEKVERKDPPPAVAEEQPQPPPRAPEAESEAPHITQAMRERAAELYTDILIDISQSKWRPGSPVSAEIPAALNEWLERYGVGYKPSENVQLLKNRVLPAAAEYIKYLVLQSSRLKGEALPLQQSARQQIAKVTSRGIETIRRNRYGRSAIKHSWQTLRESDEVMVDLGKLAFEDQALPLREMRPYLVTLLLLGRYDGIQRLIDDVPATSEARNWQSLVRDMRGAVVEKRASRLWRGAREARAGGDTQTALRMLKMLVATASEFVENHAEEIAAFREACYRASPTYAAAKRTQKAAMLLEEAPADALRVLAGVFTEWGRLDFPEKADAVAIRQKALTKISEFPHYKAVIGGDNSMLGDEGRYCLIRLHQMREEDERAKHFRSREDAFLEAAFRSAVLLDIGDWFSAMQTFPGKLLADSYTAIPLKDRVHVAHAAIRLAGRYAPNGPAKPLDLDVFDDFAETLEEEREAVRVLNAAFELGLEAGPGAFGDWKTGRNPPDIPVWRYWRSERQHQLMVQFSWLLMHGHGRDALELIEPLLPWFERSDELPGGPFVAMVRRLHASAKGENPLTVVDLLKGQHRLATPFWRAGLSEILHRYPDSGWQKGTMPDRDPMLRRVGRGPLAASIMADWATLKLAGVLGHGGPAKAAEWAGSLADTLPRVLRPFRVELQFYRAGLELLQKNRARAAEMLEDIERCGVAAGEECRLAHYWRRHVKGERVRYSTATTPSRVLYFHHWLRAVDRQSDQARFQQRRELEAMTEHAPSPARRAFSRRSALLLGTE